MGFIEQPSRITFVPKPEPIHLDPGIGGEPIHERPLQLPKPVEPIPERIPA